MQAIDDCAVVRGADLVLLAVVHDAVPGRRRAAQSVIRNKIRAQHTGLDTVLRATLAANPAVSWEGGG